MEECRKRNIYIDTTGFCKELLDRVDAALCAISFGLKRVSYGMSNRPLKGVSNDGSLLGCTDVEEIGQVWLLDNPRQVSLSELEALAGIENNDLSAW